MTILLLGDLTGRSRVALRMLTYELKRGDMRCLLCRLR